LEASLLGKHVTPAARAVGGERPVESGQRCRRTQQRYQVTAARQAKPAHRLLDRLVGGRTRSAANSGKRYRLVFAIGRGIEFDRQAPTGGIAARSHISGSAAKPLS